MKQEKTANLNLLTKPFRNFTKKDRRDFKKLLNQMNKREIVSYEYEESQDNR